jgi:hypothetical protein
MRNPRTLKITSLFFGTILCAAILSGCGDEKNEKPGSRPDKGMTLIQQSPPDYSHLTEDEPMTAEQRASAPPRRRANRGNLAAAYVGVIQDRDIVASRRLRSIGALIRVYKRRNDGAYPKSLRELVEVGLAAPKLMQSARDSERQMIYRRPVGPRPGSAILLYDPCPNKYGKTTVCRIDLLIQKVDTEALTGKSTKKR